MSRPSRKKVPGYCRHKGKGLAYIRLNGRAHYLGAYDSPESHERYRAAVAEWLSTGRAPGENAKGLTIVELCAAFWRHTQATYRQPDGTPTKMHSNVQMAIRSVENLYGNELASSFGPVRLQIVRDGLIDAGLARSTINKVTNLIRMMYKWGVSQELIEPTVYTALTTVAGLRRGRSAAREPEPIQPVDLAVVEATKQFLPRPITALIELQLATGARPGELLKLRLADLKDTDREVWTAPLNAHKTSYIGRQRTLYFGPVAQGIIKEFMGGRAVDEPLFSPREAVAERATYSRTHRRKGQKPNARKTRRRVGRCYTVDTYRRAIHRACDKTFPPPDGLSETELQAWRREHRWAPHQLRHRSATEIRKRYGLEASQLVLGHGSAALTDAVYAQRDEGQVRRIMAEVG